MHWFVERPCAENVRYTRLTESGDFNGYFEDREITLKTLLAKGHYVKGKKHGLFEEYYPDGKVKSRGEYKDDRPIGIWEYFHENGLPERTMQITETDTLIIRLFTKNGIAKIEDGQGEFEGFVQARQMSSPFVLAKGKIVNGKPDGEWTSITYNEIYAKETFENGRFIKGRFPNARTNKHYTQRPLLNTFFFDSYLGEIELFKVRKCRLTITKLQRDSIRSNAKKTSDVEYKFDMNRFRSELRPKIDKQVESDFKTGKSRDYSTNNLITIQFSINDKGKPHNFKLLSGFGYEFYTALISTIRAHAKFPPGTEDLYFHLNLHFPGGSTYQYDFAFSRERRFAGQ